jgi:hypothetical protein
VQQRDDRLRPLGTEALFDGEFPAEKILELLGLDQLGQRRRRRRQAGRSQARRPASSVCAGSTGSVPV